MPKGEPAFAQVSIPSQSASSKGDTGKLQGVSIDVAANGFVVRERREPPKAKRGDYPSYREPKELVFESAESVLAHLGKVLK